MSQKEFFPICGNSGCAVLPGADPFGGLLMSHKDGARSKWHMCRTFHRRLWRAGEQVVKRLWLLWDALKYLSSINLVRAAWVLKYLMELVPQLQAYSWGLRTFALKCETFRKSSWCKTCRCLTRTPRSWNSELPACVERKCKYFSCYSGGELLFSCLGKLSGFCSEELMQLTWWWLPHGPSCRFCWCLGEKHSWDNNMFILSVSIPLAAWLDISFLAWPGVFALAWAKDHALRVIRLLPCLPAAFTS